MYMQSAEKNENPYRPTGWNKMCALNIKRWNYFQFLVKVSQCKILVILEECAKLAFVEKVNL